MRTILTAILLLFVLSSYGNDTLTVDLNEFRPMVIIDSNKYSGFDVELWDAVAKEAGLSYKFVNIPDFDNIFTSLQKGKSNVALSGISITHDREEKIDFSHKYFESGLSILVKDEIKQTWRSEVYFYLDLVKSISGYILFFFGFMVIMSILTMLSEKKTNPQFKSFMWDGVYWVNVVLATVGFGDKCPITRRGKLIAMFLMCVGIFFITPMIVGKITSEMTAHKFSEFISCKEDLKGRSVGTIEATTSVTASKKLGAKVHIYKNMEEAIKALRAGDVCSVIFDMPAIKYEANRNNDLRALDMSFDRQDYGIALSKGSPFRKRINIALLALEENGTYDKIYTKYFGEM